MRSHGVPVAGHGVPLGPLVGRLRLARACTVLLLAGLGLLVGAGPAAGHAVLVDADPRDGAVLESAPQEVSLGFNEPVTLPEGGLRVFDADARRVDEGVVDTDADERIAVALPDDLPEGGYLVVYRVISDDSHPVAGVVGFTVGEGAAVGDDVVAELLGDDAWLGATAGILRGLGYLTTLLAAGAALFAAVVAPTDADRARARRLARNAAAAGLVVALGAFPVQTMVTTGAGLVEALGPTAVGETAASTFGQAWLLRVVALAVLILVTLSTARRWPAVALGGLAAGAFVLDGHQRTVEPTWLLAAGDVVHLIAGALWLGGLVLLAVTVRARRLGDDPVGAARLVARFSTVALWSVLALTVSGTAMAWALVRVPDALVTTGYGWTLLAKVALVALAVAVAAYNHRQLVPAITARVLPAGGSVDAGDAVDADGRAPAATSPRSRAAWRRLGGTVAVEAVLLVAVLLVTGFLVTQRPAAEAAGITGFYETTEVVTEDLDLHLVVDPNEAGRTNAIHLYVLDATGRPAGDVDDLSLDLTYADQDIGPFPVEPFFAGPGHWVANVDELTFPGEWTVRVTFAVDRFEEEQVEVTVPVR